MRDAHTREPFYRARHEEQPDEAAFEGWLENHCRLAVIDLVDHFGFARARDKLASMLCERSSGRPVVIDHLREETH